MLIMIPFLLFYAVPAGAQEKEERKWQDENIYFIMVDRFFDGNVENNYDVNPKDPRAYHGGDLEGVIQKLDYIQKMGFTTIWLTPIMDNQPKGYHGYWITDFKKVDEHFGTIEDAKRLVDEAHKRNMKVIFDFVVNHTGSESPWLNDPEKKDWFHEKKNMIGNSQNVLENAWLSGLPDLNQDNPEVKQYLFDAADYWINKTGVDGFRLDTVKHVPKTFWKEFADHVKSVDPDFFLLGEVWSMDPSYIAEYEKTGIDSFVNYPFYDAAVKAFAEPGNSIEPLSTVWARSKYFFDQPELLGNFLDNHDNKRFTRIALEHEQNPVTRWKLALTYLYTTPGIPIVYQGSEIPQDGGNDPDNRRMMDFKSYDKDYKQYIERIGELRQQLPALRRGDFETVVSEKEFAIYKRTYQDQTVYLAFNNDVQTRSAELADISSDKQLRGVLHDDIVRKSEDGTFKIGLDRESAEIYVVEKNSGINVPFVGGMIAIFVLFVGFVIYLSRRGKTTA